MSRFLSPPTIVLCALIACSEGTSFAGKSASQEMKQALMETARMINKNLPQQLRASDMTASSRAMLDDITDTQRRLITAQGLFNEATSEGEDEAERAIEKELAAAVSSVEPTLGKPTFPVIRARELVCLPDLNQCPKGWEAQGAGCVATSAQRGPCKQSPDFFAMGTSEKLALVRYCKFELHCQDDCTPNLDAACPSLWLQISEGVCEAPLNYVGDCDHRVTTSSMTDKDKLSFSGRCGARWPCKANQAGCERDHTAECPLGWQRRGADCIAPAEYTRCSRVQNFGHMSPQEKQSWSRKCGVSWPCVGQ